MNKTNQNQKSINSSSNELLESQQIQSEKRNSQSDEQRNKQDKEQPKSIFEYFHRTISNTVTSSYGNDQKLENVSTIQNDIKLVPNISEIIKYDKQQEINEDDVIILLNDKIQQENVLDENIILQLQADKLWISFQNFKNNKEKKIYLELDQLMSIIIKTEYSAQMIRVLFYFTVLNLHQEFANELYLKFRDEIEEPQFDVIFGFDSQFDFKTYKSLRENFINNKEQSTQILLSCIQNKLFHLAESIINQTNYCEFQITILIQFFEVFQTIKNSDYIKNLKRYQSIEQLKQQIYQHLSKFQRIKKMSDQEIQILINELFLELIEYKQEILACKLLSLLQTENKAVLLLHENTLNYALLNQQFLLIKQLFWQIVRKQCNYFPNSIIFNSSKSIQSVVNLLNQDHNFIHFLYLIFKVQMVKIQELDAANITKQLNEIINLKVLMFSNMLNPILVAVFTSKMIDILIDGFRINIQLLLKIQKRFDRLALYIYEKITEDFIIEGIMLKNFQINPCQTYSTLIFKIYFRQYPSMRQCLLQLLLEQPERYKQILVRPEIIKICSKLWICNIQWTFDFMKASSTWYNLNQILDVQKIKHQSNQIKKFKRYEKYLLNQKITIQSREQSRQQQKSFQQRLIESLDFQVLMPKITQLNYNNQLHILSFQYWAKSPRFRAFLEIIIYIIMLIYAVQNAFQIFEIRRFYQTYSKNFLLLLDGIQGYGKQLGSTEYLRLIWYNLCANPPKYLPNPSIPNPTLADFEAFRQECQTYYTCQLAAQQQLLVSKTKTVCDTILVFQQSFSDQCSLYNSAYYKLDASIDIFFYMQAAFFGISIQSLFGIIFQQYTMGKIQKSFKLFIDILITILNIVIITIYIVKVKLTQRLIIRNQQLDVMNQMEQLTLVFIFLMWIKIFDYLRLTSRLGFTIITIYRLFREIMSFMIIYCIFLLCCSSIFTNFFSQSNPSQFGSLLISLRTVLLFSYGQVKFENYKDSEAIASVVVILFGLISVVLLLNLLIAIITNITQSINSQSTLELARLTYKNYQMGKYQSRLSSLVSIILPHNILFLPVIVILLFKKQKKSFNLRIMYCYYFTFVINWIALFFVINLIIIPIQYLNQIKNLIILLKYQQTDWLNLLSWTILGIPYQLYILLINDLSHFIKSCFLELESYVGFEYISKQDMLCIKQVVDQLNLENIEQIDKQKFKQEVLNLLQNNGYKRIDSLNDLNNGQSHLGANYNFQDIALTNFINQFADLDNKIQIRPTARLFYLNQFNKIHDNFKSPERLRRHEQKLIQNLQLIDLVSTIEGLSEFIRQEVNDADIDPQKYENIVQPKKQQTANLDIMLMQKFLLNLNAKADSNSSNDEDNEDSEESDDQVINSSSSDNDHSDFTEINFFLKDQKENY